ncbi:MAG TPA: metallophosphoesterase [Tepidisphaeraceae bacterium]|jgi:Icc-related predicted phosphoesterase
MTMTAQRMTVQADGVVRVAAIGDVHCSHACPGALQPVFAQVAKSADVLVLCGDLTNHGLPEEAQALVRELTAIGQMPVVAVLGNHDFESGRVDEVQRILTGGGIHLLDGDAVELHGVAFAGVKGFAGGFERGTLSAFGEPAIKRFVQEAVEEAKKLESALARTKAAKKIAVLHYAPIRATVEGEPCEILPFLGSGRLEEPIDRYQVTAAVHGHAHRGAPEGRTRAGVPVYNVAIPVMRNAFPNRPPFRVLDVHAAPVEDGQLRAPAEAPVETDVG